MAIFRTRNPQRDRDTDRRRLNRLVTLLRAIIEEMAAERDGLEARQRRTEQEAAFSMLAFEDGGDGCMSDRVNELTASLMEATERLKSLEGQMAFAGRLLDEATAFGKASAPPPT